METECIKYCDAREYCHSSLLQGGFGEFRDSSYRTELIRPCPSDYDLLESAEYPASMQFLECLGKRIYLSTAKSATIYLKRLTPTGFPTEYGVLPTQTRLLF